MDIPSDTVTDLRAGWRGRASSLPGVHSRSTIELLTDWINNNCPNG
jgi:hypothetical protein